MCKQMGEAKASNASTTCVELGISSFLNKPVKADQLEAALQESLQVAVQ
jgi:ActR/RegA family two-component response regulator